jgi:mannan endo-1,4-beta-mannosidase
MSSPWTALGANSTNGVDIPELLNPSPTLLTNQTARSNYLAWRDNMASNLTILRDAGVVVMFRPCSEMNGTWFWWGNKPRAQYLALWRDLHDYLTITRSLTNLLWVYESASQVHLVGGSTSASGIPNDYYYPGDEYVDVVGHNFYDDDWTLTYDSDTVMRRYEKVFAVPQAGPGPTRDGSFDNFIYLNGASNTIPRTSFFCVWNSYTNFSGALTTHIGIVDNLNASNLMAHPLVVTRDEVNWQYELPQRAAVVRTNGNLLRVDWQGGVLQESTNLGSWSDVIAAPRPHHHDTAADPARFWRVRK